MPPEERKRNQFMQIGDTRVNGVIMSRVLKHWRGGLANIEQTFDDAMELVATIPANERVSLCIGCFHELAIQQKQGQDVEVYMRGFIEAIKPTEYEIACLIDGYDLNWTVRDEHMIFTLPTAMSLMEDTHDRAFIRRALDHITDQIMGVACRNEEHAIDLLEKIKPYFSPDDSQVRLDTGSGRASWVKCWINHAYQANLDKCVGHSALAWLVDWGIDVDARNDYQKTELENTLLGDIPHKGEFQLHLIECLTEAGANWEKLYENGDENQKKLLLTSSTVKKTLLGRVAEKDGLIERRAKPKI